MQVAVGFMMAAQGSDVIRRMIDLMQEKFDGGWVSHSVNMVDAFFDQRKYAAAAAPPCDECLVLPYGALFPFSWNRKDLCCDYYYHEGKPATSLFGGTGFRWDAQYVWVVPLEDSFFFFFLFFRRRCSLWQTLCADVGSCSSACTCLQIHASSFSLGFVCVGWRSPFTLLLD